ncbi:MAG TPA: hypothetical protein VK524_20875 [Polyangiaceae bacterium]|nr:hypothetical protein [Polyangiaceae bacterium]
MRRSALGLALLAASGVACKRAETTSQTHAPSASASAARPDARAPSAAALAQGVPLPAERIASAVNPKRLAAYSGPVGSVHGTVRIKGDRAPVNTSLPIQPGCTLSRDMYGPLFREGMQRAAADVLVTVTGYEGYVPAREPGQQVEASGCAWNKRTLALTFGQRLEVVSKDRQSYMPRLLGARILANLVLVPGGDPIRLYPEQPGRYELKDTFHENMSAEVFVVKFATFDVTGLDGTYEITGIPAGDVTLSAFLPAAQQVSEKKLQVKANTALELDIELPFDRKAWEKQLRARKEPPQKP